MDGWPAAESRDDCSSNKWYWFKCPKGIHPSELKSISNFTGGHVGSIGCIGCNSIGEWLLKNLPFNEANNIILRWDKEKNGCNIFQKSYSSVGINGKGFWLKCLVHSQHRSELHSFHDFIQRFNKYDKIAIGLNCNQCNSFAQWGIDNICEDFLEKYWDYDKNDELGINPWNISYGSKKKIWIKCQEKDYHKSYNITSCDFIKGSRCSYCSGKKVHPLDSIGRLLEDEGLLSMWSNKNKKSPYEYSKMSEQKVYWVCLDNKHVDYLRKIQNVVLYNFRCPSCVRERKESFLQEKVRLYLESLNIGQVLHEYNCTIIPKISKQKGNNCMPFDNELIIKNNIHLVAEVQGEQHYKITALFHHLSARKHKTTAKQEFHNQKVRDRYKRMYAKSKGYEYLEIPYWTDNNENEWQQLIDNKINEILNKNNGNFQEAI